MSRFRRSDTKKSTIPKLPFFAIRTVQCVCCIIVLGVLGYFQHHLWRNDYSTPWEFALLDTAAALTLFNAVVTGVLLCCWGLSPLYIIVVDSFLTIFWTISFALLLRAMGPTTTQSCNAREWGNSAGIRVCHLFKNLVAFALFCVVSFAGSVVFAVIVGKRTKKTHRYAAAVNTVNTRVANQDTGYHGAPQTPGTPNTFGTMETMLKRQSAMSMGESQMKHMSTASQGTSVTSPAMQQSGWAPVQPASPGLAVNARHGHVSTPSK